MSVACRQEISSHTDLRAHRLRPLHAGGDRMNSPCLGLGSAEVHTHAHTHTHKTHTHTHTHTHKHTHTHTHTHAHPSSAPSPRLVLQRVQRRLGAGVAQLLVDRVEGVPGGEGAAPPPAHRLHPVVIPSVKPDRAPAPRPNRLLQSACAVRQLPVE